MGQNNGGCLQYVYFADMSNSCHMVVPAHLGFAVYVNYLTLPLQVLRLASTYSRA